MNLQPLQGDQGVAVGHLVAGQQCHGIGTGHGVHEDVLALLGEARIQSVQGLEELTGQDDGVAGPWLYIVAAVAFVAVGGLLAFGLAMYLFNWDRLNEARRGHPLMALLAMVPIQATSEIATSRGVEETYAV